MWSETLDKTYEELKSSLPNYDLKRPDMYTIEVSRNGVIFGVFGYSSSRWHRDWSCALYYKNFQVKPVNIWGCEFCRKPEEALKKLIDTLKDLP